MKQINNHLNAALNYVHQRLYYGDRSRVSLIVVSSENRQQREAVEDEGAYDADEQEDLFNSE